MKNTTSLKKVGYVGSLIRLGFDYLVISNEDFDVDSLVDTISFFHSIGIRKFIFTVSYDPLRHTEAWLTDRMKRLKPTLNAYRPRGCSMTLYADTVHSSGVPHGIHSYRRLCVPHSSAIFIRLSPFGDPSQIDPDLNELCFTRKCRPICTAFEDNIRTCEPDWIRRMMASRSLCFAMDLNFMTATDSEPLMRHAIAQDCRIIPAISHSISNYPGILYRMEAWKEEIGESNYTKFLRQVHTTGYQLFPRD